MHFSDGGMLIDGSLSNTIYLFLKGMTAMTPVMKFSILNTCLSLLCLELIKP